MVWIKLNKMDTVRKMMMETGGYVNFERIDSNIRAYNKGIPHMCDNPYVSKLTVTYGDDDNGRVNVSCSYDDPITVREAIEAFYQGYVTNEKQGANSVKITRFDSLYYYYCKNDEGCIRYKQHDNYDSKINDEMFNIVFYNAEVCR